MDKQPAPPDPMAQRVREIARRMDGQDNRCTTHPIFVVQERKRVYGIDPEYTDNTVWIRSDEGCEVDEEEEPTVQAEYERTGIEPEMYIRTGYVDMWEWVQPFFSERGARRYIETNRHNLTEPRVYVASGYRNDEWQVALAMLAVNEDSRSLREQIRDTLADAERDRFEAAETLADMQEHREG